MSSDIKREKMLERVRKLLELAASTNHPGEKANSLAAAQELTMRYAFEQAEIETARGRHDEQIDTLVVMGPKSGSPGAATIAALAARVGETCSCYVWRHVKTVDGETRHWLNFAGYTSDREFAELLYTSLISELERSLVEQAHTRRDFVAPRTWRAEFVNGFYHEAEERLDKMKRSTMKRFEAEGKGEMALVLADRSKRVEDWVRAQDLRLRTARSYSSAYDPAARQAGRRSAARADYSAGTTRRISERLQLGQG